MVKRLSTMWETQVQSLGQEDPPEKEMATHSSVLAWRIPGTEKPGSPGSIPRSGRSLEKGMVIASSMLVWRTPWTEESGGL